MPILDNAVNDIYDSHLRLYTRNSFNYHAAYNEFINNSVPAACDRLIFVQLSELSHIVSTSY